MMQHHKMEKNGEEMEKNIVNMMHTPESYMHKKAGKWDGSIYAYIQPT